MEASDLARDLVGLGLRSGRVEAFLLSRLKENALRSYTTALLDFKVELIFRGVPWGICQSSIVLRRRHGHLDGALPEGDAHQAGL